MTHKKKKQLDFMMSIFKKTIQNQISQFMHYYIFPKSTTSKEENLYFILKSISQISFAQVHKEKHVVLHCQREMSTVSKDSTLCIYLLKRFRQLLIIVKYLRKTGRRKGGKREKDKSKGINLWKELIMAYIVLVLLSTNIRQYS